MAMGKTIKTYFQGAWHDGDVAIMNAGDHGAWLGSNVFDGARMVNGLVPDLDLHCARVNASAEALMITPTVNTPDMIKLVQEGLALFDPGTPVYIRPMYWAIDGGDLGILPSPDTTGFTICLEEIPFAPPTATATLTTTQFRRPTLDNNVVNAKAGCLYPNNNRMLAEARSKGFTNVLSTDVAGNVAETATANIFMVKDGVVKTPIANGTFLAGITRARHISNLRAADVTVVEQVLTYADFHAADEVFMSGNMSKVTPVTQFEDTHYQVGPLTQKTRDLYWDWAAQHPLI
ncbi:branched-chain amino acid aminotransferase [Algirhabdus cladophorae]|uniref:branched-chain amino acid aminotransferase n=1 Tax=Algirhabdus cladophorae TaxID=3377108 RepID=UPI003B84A72B